MWRHWREQGISFDVILVGYLGSIRAVEVVSEILDTMLTPNGISIVDPAMADHGRLYSGFDESYPKAMQGLCEKAHIMLPNITEAAMMAGVPYRAEFDETYIRELLTALKGREVVLTGVGFHPEQTGAAVLRDGEISFIHHKRLDRNFHGTGDIFAACFTGSLMQGKNLEEAVQIASEFTCRSIEATIENPAHWYGVKFETALPWLIKNLY
jgi:pyridoxine kinase